MILSEQSDTCQTLSEFIESGLLHANQLIIPRGQVLCAYVYVCVCVRILFVIL